MSGYQLEDVFRHGELFDQVRAANKVEKENSLQLARINEE